MFCFVFLRYVHVYVSGIYVEWVLQEESLSLTKAHGKSTFGQKEFL